MVVREVTITAKLNTKLQRQQHRPYHYEPLKTVSAAPTPYDGPLCRGITGRVGIYHIEVPGQQHSIRKSEKNLVLAFCRMLWRV